MCNRAVSIRYARALARAKSNATARSSECAHELTHLMALSAAESESLRGLGEAGRLLFESRHSGDVTLVLETGEQERVHKVVLELRSAYFKSLLRYTPRSRTASSPKCAGVKLTGFTKASLSAIVEWIYCGEGAGQSVDGTALLL